MEKQTKKICGKCKEVFPLTGEYFFIKITKKGTVINGHILKNDSISFRSMCKKCHRIDGAKRNRKHTMIKYNASSEKELDEAIYASRINSGKLGNQAQIGKPSSKRKYDYPENASIKTMSKIRIIKDMGYDPKTYSVEWKKRWLEKAKASRKYTYPDEYDKVPKSLINKKTIENLTNAYLANRLGFKLNDIPSEILDIKRKQLKFYRYVKNKKNQIRKY